MGVDEELTMLRRTQKAQERTSPGFLFLADRAASRLTAVKLLQASIESTYPLSVPSSSFWSWSAYLVSRPLFSAENPPSDIQGNILEAARDIYPESHT